MVAAVGRRMQGCSSATASSIPLTPACRSRFSPARCSRQRTAKAVHARATQATRLASFVTLAISSCRACWRSCWSRHCDRPKGFVPTRACFEVSPTIASRSPSGRRTTTRLIAGRSPSLRRRPRCPDSVLRSVQQDRRHRADGVSEVLTHGAGDAAVAAKQARRPARVAERVGYSSAGTVSVAFSRHAGLPPV